MTDLSSPRHAQVLGVHPLAGADEVRAGQPPPRTHGLCLGSLLTSTAPTPVLLRRPATLSSQFARARARKVAAAGDDAAALAKVDAAYDAIMMRQLALRMKGQGPIGGIGVSKEVAFADREVRCHAWGPPQMLQIVT
jgi:hypothetical protein